MVYSRHVKRLFSGFILIIWMSWPVLVAQSPQSVPDRVSGLEQQVQKHLQEQKPQLAIPLLREIVSLDPRNVNGQANLGVLLFFQGGYSEAIPHLRSALQLQADLWRLEALLGIAEKRTGDPKQAVNDLERAFPKLDDKKFQIQAGLELIELHIRLAQLDNALSLAAKLEELAPQDPQVLFVHYQVARQMMYQTLLSMMVAAPDSAEMHMIMAGELGRQGDRGAAIAQYREAIRLNPKLPGVHFELAEQLRSSSDARLNAQAEDEYKAAVRVNAYDGASWRRLGEILSAKGDFKAAEEGFQKALAVQPRDSDAETGMAIALISTNRPNEALPLLESAIKDDPTNLVAHYRLSGLYRRAGRAEDAQREMETFRHYQDVKDKIGKVYKGLASPADPMGETGK
jgi:tetratricopeptide (TPR) repeat protein